MEWGLACFPLGVVLAKDARELNSPYRVHVLKSKNYTVLTVLSHIIIIAIASKLPLSFSNAELICPSP